MAITREKKVDIAKRLDDALEGAGSVVFVRFRGLGVTDTTHMRRELKEKGVGYYVAKKTLIKRALDEKNYAGEAPSLEGEIALVYSEDPTAAAREINSFAKTSDEKLKIVGGVFEGAFMNESAMMEVALIPSRETLLAQFVTVINSPIQGFASVLNQYAEKNA